MTADPALLHAPSPPSRRFSVTPFIELLVLAGAIAIAVATYFVVTAGGARQELLTPATIALLLIANLLPGIALMVLLGRRIAMRRAARSPIGGRGRLHVRLVALFSIIAAVPTLFVVVFASVLFQFGVQFWYSDQARGMIENATGVAKTSYQQMLQRWQEATITAAADMSGELQKKLKDPEFPEYFFKQIYFRSLSDGFLFIETPDGKVQEIIKVNPDNLTLKDEVSPDDMKRLARGLSSITTVKGDRIKTVTMLPATTNVFLLTVAISDVRVMEEQSRRSSAILASYRDLLTRSRSLQLKFNAALLAISLLIVGIAVWIALEAADRLVRPVGELVAAAHRVAAGDLAARVTAPQTDDEVGILSNAFNQMTGQLEAQTGALESRRALIEAVMSGVSAGVVAVTPEGTIRLINRSATTFLNTGTDSPVGRPLADISSELAAMIGSDTRDAIVEIESGGSAKTLAVKIARSEDGPILTFDDITEQLLDQRRAAWSDVARRIAHEIKNPLTPIQLAAERLQRRYGKQLPADDGTFARLTETIVRQVGDLRRMVDEFSSFARMPKPIFRTESIGDIAKQSLFLHEVAHPAITFTMVSEDAGLELVCDRRQIGQALTNIVKNAVEAIDARNDDGGGDITLTLSGENGRTIGIEIADNGVGLPAARDRIVEPYMTTRARGTGLGLAIVNKIVEEHCGTMKFDDREGGGTRVTMTFDAQALAAMDVGDDADRNGGSAGGNSNDRRPAELTRNRT